MTLFGLEKKAPCSQNQVVGLNNAWNPGGPGKCDMAPRPYRCGVIGFIKAEGVDWRLLPQRLLTNNGR